MLLRRTPPPSRRLAPTASLGSSLPAAAAPAPRRAQLYDAVPRGARPGREPHRYAAEADVLWNHFHGGEERVDVGAVQVHLAPAVASGLYGARRGEARRRVRVWASCLGFVFGLRGALEEGAGEGADRFREGAPERLAALAACRGARVTARAPCGCRMGGRSIAHRGRRGRRTVGGRVWGRVGRGGSGGDGGRWDGGRAVGTRAGQRGGGCRRE